MKKPCFFATLLVLAIVSIVSLILLFICKRNSRVYSDNLYYYDRITRN